MESRDAKLRKQKAAKVVYLEQRHQLAALAAGAGGALLLAAVDEAHRDEERQEGAEQQDSAGETSCDEEESQESEEEGAQAAKRGEDGVAVRAMALAHLDLTEGTDDRRPTNIVGHVDFPVKGRVYRSTR